MNLNEDRLNFGLAHEMLCESISRFCLQTFVKAHLILFSLLRRIRIIINCQ